MHARKGNLPVRTNFIKTGKNPMLNDIWKQRHLHSVTTLKPKIAIHRKSTFKMVGPIINLSGINILSV